MRPNNCPNIEIRVFNKQKVGDAVAVESDVNNHWRNTRSDWRGKYETSTACRTTTISTKILEIKWQQCIIQHTSQHPSEHCLPLSSERTFRPFFHFLSKTDQQWKCFHVFALPFQKQRRLFMYDLHTRQDSWFDFRQHMETISREQCKTKQAYTEHRYSLLSTVWSSLLKQ